MRKSKKEQPKPTPEQRAQDLWDQHVFMIRKRYHDSEKRITMVMKAVEKQCGKPFQPNELATDLLKELMRDPATLTSSPSAPLRV